MLINSIQEVEALLLLAAAERKRLHRYHDSINERNALTTYINACINILQRTNLYFYDQLYKSADYADALQIEDIKEQFQVALKNLKKDEKIFNISGLGYEVVNYFYEKESIVRGFKNLLSDSDLTYKKENNKLKKLATKYQFVYHANTEIPGCPILPDLGDLSVHKWEDGIIEYFYEEDIGKPLLSLEDNRYDIIFPPKPITRESRSEQELFPADYFVGQSEQIGNLGNMQKVQTLNFEEFTEIKPVKTIFNKYRSEKFLKMMFDEEEKK